MRHLLEVDLDRASLKQKENTRYALKKSPSTLTLITSVKSWAVALSEVCRSYASKCVEGGKVSNKQDPASLALETILGVVCGYLGVPSQKFFSSLEEWPETNAVRKFIMEVTDAPVEIRDGQLFVKPILPRWEPKSRFARALAGLGSNPPRPDPFLSLEESASVLTQLEESFADALYGGLQAAYSEAILSLGPLKPGPPKQELSKFEKLVGPLFNKALENEKHRVSQKELEAISRRVDALALTPSDILEKRARDAVAEHNKWHPRGALKSWLVLATHPRFRTFVRRRFARAAEKYRKSRP